MINIGSRLKSLRKKLGLSQLELSQKSNISQASIARIEADKQKNLEIGTIEKLAASLGIQVSHFLDEPLAVKEDAYPYETVKRIPVIRLDEFIKSKGSINKRKGIKPLEPTFSRDPKAFFLEISGSFANNPIICKGDLLLIEPSCLISDGDLVVLLSHNKNSMGKMFISHPLYILQSFEQGADPLVFDNKKQKDQEIRLFRISEIRKKAPAE